MIKGPKSKIQSNNLLVSIIIPVFNRAELISETLESIIAQTYTNWECIVVDDGSSDNTECVVENYVKKDSRFRLYKRPEKFKSGGNGARNYGFKVSKGEFIQWFDSDDLMHPEKLMHQVNALNKHRDADLSICNGQIFEINDDGEIIFKEYIRFHYTKFFFSEIASRSQNINLQSILFRRKIISEDVLFNEELLRSQEYEFISRVFLKVSNIIFINEVLFYYRKNPTSISNKFFSEKNDYIYSTFLARKIVFKLAHKNKGMDKKILLHILSIYYYCLVRFIKKIKIKYVFEVLYQIFLVFIFYPYSILLIKDKLLSK